MFNDQLDEEQTIAEERAAEIHMHEVLAGTLRRLDSLQSVISLRGTDTVQDAVAAMIDRSVGCVLVTEDNKLLGLFSERDLVTRVVAKGLDPSHVALAEVMTKEPEALTRDSRIVFALNKMTVGGFRHIPIINSEGRPEAVVSMRDVVEHVVSYYADLVFNLPASEQNIPTSREGA